MGNLVRRAQGDGAPHVHGVLHRLAPADFARLANMEHEYRQGKAQPLPAFSGVGAASASPSTHSTPSGREVPPAAPLG